MKSPNGSVFSQLTGHEKVDVSGKGDDVAGMLRAIGGSSDRTKSGINLTAAAEKLKVSRRTVERWHHSATTGRGQQPSADNLAKLRAAARKIASTQRGRKKALRDIREQGRFAKGAQLSINGQQGPRYSGKDYSRLRQTSLYLDAEATADLMAAYERYGDKGFHMWAENYYDENYVSDWEFKGDFSVEGNFTITIKPQS